MGKHLMDLGTAIVAAMLVMVFHELPKTIVYYTMDKTSSKRSLLNALKFQHYIDPIGLIFSVATYGGFSKPYLYRIKDKRLNRALGMAGYLSLILMYIISIILLKYGFGVHSFNGSLFYNTSMNHVNVILMYLCFNIAFMSFGMFVVNLFPIATFDMGNIIAGISPTKFFEYLRRDYIMKVILIFVLIFDVVTSLNNLLLTVLLK